MMSMFPGSPSITISLRCFLVLPVSSHHTTSVNTPEIEKGASASLPLDNPLIMAMYAVLRDPKLQSLIPKHAKNGNKFFLFCEHLQKQNELNVCGVQYISLSDAKKGKSIRAKHKCLADHNWKQQTVDRKNRKCMNHGCLKGKKPCLRLATANEVSEYIQHCRSVGIDLFDPKGYVRAKCIFTGKFVNPDVWPRNSRKKKGAAEKKVNADWLAIQDSHHQSSYSKCGAKFGCKPWLRMQFLFKLFDEQFVANLSYDSNGMISNIDGKKFIDLIRYCLSKYTADSMKHDLQHIEEMHGPERIGVEGKFNDSGKEGFIELMQEYSRRNNENSKMKLKPSALSNYIDTLRDTEKGFVALSIQMYTWMYAGMRSGNCSQRKRKLDRIFDGISLENNTRKRRKQ